MKERTFKIMHKYNSLDIIPNLEESKLQILTESYGEVTYCTLSLSETKRLLKWLSAEIARCKNDKTTR